MKTTKRLFIIIQICFGLSLFAQQNEIIPDLAKINDTDLWVLHNREIGTDKVVHLDAKPGNGLLWIKEPIFTNGRIELDIKGKDDRGRSFVGLAFHGLNESTYEAIYFRPFNFKNPDRNAHSVQYISHPEYTWDKLRREHPEKYENQITPVPEPTDWFHVTIIVKHPTVNVFVNNSKKASLTIEQLSLRKEGWVGFWVGNNSEGFFKNLKIIPE